MDYLGLKDERRAKWIAKQAAVEKRRRERAADEVTGMPRGWHSLVADAALAHELFGDDELERYAEEQRKCG